MSHFYLSILQNQFCLVLYGHCHSLKKSKPKIGVHGLRMQYIYLSRLHFRLDRQKEKKRIKSPKKYCFELQREKGSLLQDFVKTCYFKCGHCHSLKKSNPKIGAHGLRMQYIHLSRVYSCLVNLSSIFQFHVGPSNLFRFSHYLF